MTSRVNYGGAGGYLFSSAINVMSCDVLLCLTKHSEVAILPFDCAELQMIPNMLVQRQDYDVCAMPV